jgi:hypothetical protein
MIKISQSVAIHGINRKVYVFGGKELVHVPSQSEWMGRHSRNFSNIIVNHHATTTAKRMRAIVRNMVCAKIRSSIHNRDTFAVAKHVGINKITVK